MKKSGKNFLNLDQSPEELERIYKEDYYWYLKSPEFGKAFLRPLGDMISDIGGTVLDVGCGEAQLFEYLDHRRVSYIGIDGSREAVKKAIDRDVRWVYLSRIEKPIACLRELCPTVIVFGGILSVLVKPEHRLDFIKMYLDEYCPAKFIIYDLLTLDTAPISAEFEELKGFATEADMPGLMEVKRRRKVILYRA